MTGDGGAATGSEHPARLAALTEEPWTRWSLAIAVTFLVFLIYPVLGVLGSDAGTLPVAGTLTAIGVFVVLYLVGYTERHPWWVLAGLLLLTAATVPLLGAGALGLMPYVAVHSALHLPRPTHLPVTLLCALSPLVTLLLGHPEATWFLTVTLPVGLGMLAMRQMDARGSELQEVRTAYAVSAERERVARDVHDVLGHSLTAIVLKADLTERLIGRDDERARAEVAEVAELARQALAEARSTVVGLRSPLVETELDRAADLAGSAGTVLAVEGNASLIPPRFRPVSAWVVREAVTNAVRHADAERLTVRLAADRVEVVDDGHGAPTGFRAGHGMAGIRERAEAIGGAARWTDASPGTRLTLTFPEES